MHWPRRCQRKGSHSQLIPGLREGPLRAAEIRLATRRYSPRDQIDRLLIAQRRHRLAQPDRDRRPPSAARARSTIAESSINRSARSPVSSACPSHAPRRAARPQVAPTMSTSLSTPERDEPRQHPGHLRQRLRGVEVQPAKEGRSLPGPTGGPRSPANHVLGYLRYLDALSSWL